MQTITLEGGPCLRPVTASVRAVITKMTAAVTTSPTAPLPTPSPVPSPGPLLCSVDHQARAVAQKSDERRVWDWSFDSGHVSLSNKRLLGVSRTRETGMRTE